MIRANSIKRIRQQVIVEPLIAALKDFGFKYLKTDECFKRKKGDYNHRITCSLEYNPISYNEDLDKCVIKFRIGGHIDAPNFVKWYNQLNLGTNTYFHQNVFGNNCFALFEKDLFSPADFLEPSESLMFKQKMISGLFSNRGFSSPNLGHPISLDDIILNLENYIEKFNKLESAISLYKNKSGHCESICYY